MPERLSKFNGRQERNAFAHLSLGQRIPGQHGDPLKHELTGGRMRLPRGWLRHPPLPESQLKTSLT